MITPERSRIRTAWKQRNERRNRRSRTTLVGDRGTRPAGTRTLILAGADGEIIRLAKWNSHAMQRPVYTFCVWRWERRSNSVPFVTRSVSPPPVLACRFRPSLQARIT
jgi:hypothetical protein